MTGRPHGGALGRSLLEIAAIAGTLAVGVGIGVLWGVGVVVGSILGSTLPGTEGEGIAALVRSFPDIGRAWEPAIPSFLVWALAAVVVAALGPLVWKLIRAGRLAEEGAQWAKTVDLRRAALLMPDQPLPHAEAEEPSDA